MLKRGFKQMLAEANAVIDTVSVHDALAFVDDPQVLFVDVRDSDEIQQEGKVRGAVPVSRGLLEFQADPECPMYNPALTQDKKLVLYCGTGGRSALSTKTLVDMGYSNVCHIAGGFAAWVEASGPVEV